MFTTFIIQPIFNLLVLVYALLPGHNFGLAIIIFTIIIRLLLWPLVKKQLHQTTAMRKLQPEIKKIKLSTKGNRAKESAMMMELYKEKGINPIGTFPILIVQFIVLIGLYSGLRKVIAQPETFVTFAYPALQHLPWIEHLSRNINSFDNSLFGLVDLSRPAVKAGSAIYIPALILVAGSAIAQYFQSKQLMPASKDQRSLRAILRDAGSGKAADQSEVNGAVGQSTIVLLPVMVFFFTVNLPAALSLYWLTGGIVAFIQQSIVLRKDEDEMEVMADEPGARDLKAIPEAEVVTVAPVAAVHPTKKPKHHNKRKKR